MATGAVGERTPILPGSGRGYNGSSTEAVARLRSGQRPDVVTEGPLFCVYAPSDPLDVEGQPSPPQLIRYNPRHASSALSLFQLHGTAFASSSVWLHALAYCALACMVGALVFFSSQRPDLIRAEVVSEAVSYAAALTGFLLVLHLAVAVGRWRSLRLDALGGLFCASGDLAMLLAASPPRAGWGELKALVLRYCLASLELTFMQAQGSDGVLAGLAARKLLTDDEKRKLEELASKPQAMWVWIAGIFQQLAERGKLSPLLLTVVYGTCARARDAVGRGRGAFAYLDTQLSFSYVHLLSALVHVNSLALAVKCGVVGAVAVWHLTRPQSSPEQGDSFPAVSRAENLQVLFVQVFLVMCVPAFYHAILEAVAGLGEPLGDRFQDFPRRAYHLWLRTECEALHAAGDRMPRNALEVVEAMEVTAAAGC